MIYTLIHERDPIPCRTTYIEYRSPVKIFINILRNTTHFHWFSLQNKFFSSWFYDTGRGGVPFGELEKLIFLYNIKRNWVVVTPRLPQQNALQHTFHAEIAVVPLWNRFESQPAAAIHAAVKTWENLFSWIKMDSRKYSMYRFFSDSRRCFYSMYRFFTDSGRCFLRPKLSILYSMYPIGVVDICVYITHYCSLHDCMSSIVR